ERVEKGSRVVAAGLAVEGFEEDSGAKRTRICGDETATPRPGAFGGAQRRAQRDTERSAAMRAQPYAAARTFHVTLAFSQRPAGARPPLRFVLLAGGPADEVATRSDRGVGEVELSRRPTAPGRHGSHEHGG